MICSAKAKEVKCLQQSNTAEEHETTKQTIHNKQRMTLKGSNLHTKNASTFDHNPEGVEFFKKHCRAPGMPCAYEDTRVNQTNLSEQSSEQIITH